MRRHVPCIGLTAGLLAILVAGCEMQTPQSPGQDAVNPDIEYAERASAQALPPVTGDPAFILSANDPGIEWGPCPPFMPESCQLAVIQGDPEDRNADALFSLAPGSSVPEHWHTSAERMVLLSGVVEVDYEGQAPVRMEAGTYAYGPPVLPHETHCLGVEGDDDCVLFIAFEDPVDAIAGVPDQTPDDGPAFIWNADDPDLGWGPCPPFMPAGCELAVLQGNPEEPNADVFFKLSPNTTVPMHWHTSTERMVLVTGEMRVNYQGQAPVIFGPLTYAYGPAGLPHETRCGDQGECVLFIAFEEPVDAIKVQGGDLPHRR